MKIKFYGNHGWITPTDNHSCFGVYGEDTKVLFDAGSPTIVTKENVNLDAICLSHTHLDHIKNLYNLLAYMNVQGRKKPLTIYTPASLEGKISKEIIPEVPGLRNFDYKFVTEPPKELGEFKLETLLGEQQTTPAVPVFTYKISYGKRTIVYATDIALSGKLKEFAKGSDMLICDATIPDGFKECGHMTPLAVKELAEYAKPKQLILTHFELVEPEKFAEQAGYENTVLAETNLELQLTKYDTIALGGTFGPLHKGHKALLYRASELAERVYIGVSSDLMIAKKKPEPPDFNTRMFGRGGLFDFIKESQYKLEKYDIREIYSAEGRTLDPSFKLDALLVSEETLPGAVEINRKRREKGLPELAIEVLPMVLAEDGERISSTRIRKGEIAKDGKVIQDVF